MRQLITRKELKSRVTSKLLVQNDIIKKYDKLFIIQFIRALKIRTEVLMWLMSQPINVYNSWIFAGLGDTEFLKWVMLMDRGKL